METVYCGVDIGGTKLSAGLMDRRGRVLCSRSTLDHTGMDEAGVVALTGDMVRRLSGEAGVAVGRLGGVGVGMAGHMRHREGVVITTSNLKGFKNYPLADRLADNLGVRVALDNDANCQALAEHRYGAGRGYSDLVFITVSTGIGAGLILNGGLYRGQSGTAGEIGHTIVDAHSESMCTCGNRGCFMAHASTLNLRETVERKRARHRTSMIFRRAPSGASPAGSGPDDHGRRQGALPIDGKLVFECAGGDDPLALEIINEYAEYLGILLYNVFQIFNPPLIILGGGLMNWGDAFFDRMTARFHELADRMLFDPVNIVRAAIPADSGVMGSSRISMRSARQGLPSSRTRCSSLSGHSHTAPA